MLLFRGVILFSLKIFLCTLPEIKEEVFGDTLAEATDGFRYITIISLRGKRYYGIVLLSDRFVDYSGFSCSTALVFMPREVHMIIPLYRAPPFLFRFQIINIPTDSPVTPMSRPQYLKAHKLTILTSKCKAGSGVSLYE